MLCGAQVPQGRAPRGNVARELSKAFFHQRKAREEGRERSNRLSHPSIWPADTPCEETVAKMEKPTTKLTRALKK